VRFWVTSSQPQGWLLHWVRPMLIPRLLVANRRRASECYAELCRDTLIAVLEFVSIELDPTLNHGPLTFGLQAASLVRALERRKRNK